MNPQKDVHMFYVLYSNLCSYICMNVNTNMYMYAYTVVSEYNFYYHCFLLILAES